MFQSTPPRRGRPGVTVDLDGSASFQSTPPRRGRREKRDEWERGFEFQSTPPRRGRPANLREADALRDVSIHAPAKGATCLRTMHAASCSCFNPRPREGGDAAMLGNGGARLLFQSTPPRRGRRVSSIRLGCRDDMFQSTPPRRGRRVVRGRHRGCKRVSIHAPAKGATGSRSSGFSYGGVSIHAPAKGATWCSRRHRALQAGFQSTPPRRGRPDILVGSGLNS